MQQVNQNNVNDQQQESYVIASSDELFRIRLDITHNNIRLQDHLLWNPNQPFSSVSDFARILCSELGLSGDFASLITFNVIQQLQHDKLAIKQGHAPLIERVEIDYQDKSMDVNMKINDNDNHDDLMNDNGNESAASSTSEVKHEAASSNDGNAVTTEVKYPSLFRTVAESAEWQPRITVNGNDDASQYYNQPLKFEILQKANLLPLRGSNISLPSMYDGNNMPLQSYGSSNNLLMKAPFDGIQSQWA